MKWKTTAINNELISSKKYDVLHILKFLSLFPLDFECMMANESVSSKEFPAFWWRLGEKPRQSEARERESVKMWEMWEAQHDHGKDDDHFSLEFSIKLYVEVLKRFLEWITANLRRTFH